MPFRAKASDSSKQCTTCLRTLSACEFSPGYSKCKVCFSAYLRAYRQKNYERIRAKETTPERLEKSRDASRKRRSQNVDLSRQENRETQRRGRANLSDFYIRILLAGQLRVPAKDVPDELVPLKRAQLASKRALWELTTVLKTMENISDS